MSCGVFSWIKSLSWKFWYWLSIYLYILLVEQYMIQILPVCINIVYRTEESNLSFVFSFFNLYLMFLCVIFEQLGYFSFVYGRRKYLICKILCYAEETVMQLFRDLF